MQRRLGQWGACALVLGLLAAGRPAGAQVGELQAHEDGRALLALELGIFADGDYLGIDDFSVFHLSPFIRFFYPAMDQLMISADWGFAYASFDDHDDHDESDFRTGNPFIGAHYVKHGRDLRFRIGGGLTLPLANIPDVERPRHLNDALVAYATYATALAARGAWDIWLWLPETMSLVVPFRLEKGLSQSVELGVDAALAILIPIADNDGETEVFLQAAGDFAFLLSANVRLGLRLQFAWLATDDDDRFESPDYTDLLFNDDDSDGDDDFQLSFEPYVRGYLGQGGFLQARLVINLDEPAGFAFDDDGVWGLFLGGGILF
jgi:hypothetical protein